MRVIGGLLIAALGVALIVSAASLAKMFGRRDRAERHLGGTMQGFVVIGFVVIILGVMSIFGAQFVQPDATQLQLGQ